MYARHLINRRFSAKRAVNSPFFRPFLFVILILNECQNDAQNLVNNLWMINGMFSDVDGHVNCNSCCFDAGNIHIGNGICKRRRYFCCDFFFHSPFLPLNKKNQHTAQQQLLTSLRILCEPNSLTLCATNRKKRVAIYFEWIWCFFFIRQTFPVSQELNSFKIMSSCFNAVSHNFKSFWNYTDMMW